MWEPRIIRGTACNRLKGEFMGPKKWVIWVNEMLLLGIFPMDNPAYFQTYPMTPGPGKQPSEDNIIETKDFEQFLLRRIKVDGKPGNLGEKITINREKAKIHVTAESPFSKRYLKYLGKKYLKAQQFLGIISANYVWKESHWKAADVGISTCVVPTRQGTGLSSNHYYLLLVSLSLLIEIYLMEVRQICRLHLQNPSCKWTKIDHY